jgi:glycerol-3-phosphate dehydrogenase (NAD(P)+)
MKRIAIIGAGSWGTALALVAARAGNRVLLWAHDAGLAAAIEGSRENSIYLPGIALPESIQPTADIGQALDGAELALVVVPSHVCREVYTQIAPRAGSECLIVSATKGLETSTGMRMEEVAHEVLGRYFEPRYVVLSGPTFALEVARDEPSAIVAGARDASWAAAVQDALSSGRFRVYTNSDVVGVEVGGAVKNIMAIATGAVAGLGLGYNSAAALVTRGLAEISRLAVRLGGRPETLAGLAGLGDLVLTCFGSLSRNRRVGFELGRGRRLEEVIGEMREVAEGVKTSLAANELAGRVGVEMPISRGVYEMLYRAKDPRELAVELMERPLRSES